MLGYKNISLKKEDEDFGTSASDIDDYQLLRHGQWSILTAFGMMLTFWTVVQAEITTLTTSLKRISRPYPKAASGIFYLPAFIITIIDLATTQYTHVCATRQNVHMIFVTLGNICLWLSNVHGKTWGSKCCCVCLTKKRGQAEKLEKKCPTNPFSTASQCWLKRRPSLRRRSCTTHHYHRLRSRVLLSHTKKVLP